MGKRTRKIKQETIDAFSPNLNLAAFYGKVAEEFQISVGENEEFDCTKIQIAPNIQEQWHEQFEREYGEKERWKINMLLCMSGPRVNQKLCDNEVEIEENWICKIA